MSRQKGGFGGYRGRRTLTDILRLIAVVLTVLVILVLAGLFFGQKYIVQTDRGLQFQLPQALRPGKEEPDIGDISVVIQPSDSERREEPEQKPERALTAALQLPLSAVLDGTAVGSMEEAGANALILQMKGREGQLNWVSQQPLAVAAGVSGQDQSVNDALTAWNQGEVYTVARLCCFRDNTLPYQNNAVALRASYGNWRDELGLRWLDPAKAEGQAYVAGLCGELAALGFDEIALECWAYPSRGNLDVITDGPAGDRQAVTDLALALLEQIDAETEGYDVRISLVADGELLERTGLDLNSLDQWEGNIWTVGEGEYLAGLDKNADGGRIVRIVSALEGKEAGAQGVLPEPELG